MSELSSSLPLYSKPVTNYPVLAPVGMSHSTTGEGYKDAVTNRRFTIQAGRVLISLPEAAKPKPQTEPSYPQVRNEPRLHPYMTKPNSRFGGAQPPPFQDELPWLPPNLISPLPHFTSLHGTPRLDPQPIGVLRAGTRPTYDEAALELAQPPDNGPVRNSVSLQGLQYLVARHFPISVVPYEVPEQSTASHN